MTPTASAAPERARGGNRDVVVIGASAGGIEPVRALLAGLTAGLGASFFVVLHMASNGGRMLAQVLGRGMALDVRPAAEHEPILPGTVYTAVADRHLLVGADHVHLSRGPRENCARPAVDTLFRSAAVTCTSRVIGVLLSGSLDDGTAGLRAIRRCGGVAIVQDPAEAAYPSMPKSAIRHGAFDHVCPVAAMPTLLEGLIASARPPPVAVPEELALEALIAAQELPDMTSSALPQSLLTCPECHGGLIEILDASFLRFRCHTGHAFSLETLRATYDEVWERTIYSALRSQHERAALLRRMVGSAREAGDEAWADQLEERARSYEEAVELLRRFAE